MDSSACSGSTSWPPATPGSARGRWWGTSLSRVGYYAWGRLATWLGHRRTLGLASFGLSFYPALTAASPTVEWLLRAALVWGLFAAGIDISLFEGLLEVCPADRRAEFVALNTSVANAIAFVAPILGAWMAELLGIRAVLWLAFGLHLAAVVVAIYLGRRRAISSAPTEAA